MSTILSFLTKRRSLLLGALGLPVAVKAAQAAQPAPGTDKRLFEVPFDAFRDKSVEQKVQELADREEIRELISRYAQRVANGVSVADLFTDDGAFITRLPGEPMTEA